MRYRRLDANGDYTFGYGQAEFLANSPEAVAQSILTRLRLNLGEWFLDTTDGTNWKTGVLGNNTRNTRDLIIQSRILDTSGVNRLLYYDSTFDANTRTFRVAIAVDTIYGIYPNESTSDVINTNNQPIKFFTLDDPDFGLLDHIRLA